MSYKELATKIIAVEEGYMEDVYLCSEGYPTVGYGIKLGYKDQSLEEYREFPKISKELAFFWLGCEVKGVIERIENAPEFSFFSKLDDVRKAVLISMCYQLGVSGVKKFKNALKALEEGDYNKAADEMCDSLWHRQTTQRANRHSRMVATGVFLPYYE